MIGANSGIRTQDLRFTNEQSGKHKTINSKILHEARNPVDTSRDTFAPKSIITILITTSSEIPAELVNIVASWSSIPDPIKAAVQAVLAPYLTRDDGE